MGSLGAAKIGGRNAATEGGLADAAAVVAMVALTSVFGLGAAAAMGG